MLDKFLHIAIEASIYAGGKIMEVYEKDFQVFEKSDHSPLTKADQLSNEIICYYLEKTPFPIISEENKEVFYDERKTWTTCWMVDPLDGTKEFIKRNGEFTVNIALLQNNQPILGVIYVPVTKELYFADVKESISKKVLVSEGKFENFDLDKSIDLTEVTNQSETVRVVGSRSHMSNETLEFIKDIEEKTDKEVSIVSKGSSLKFCIVAEGGADMYPRFAPTMEWDTAAGHAICNAAGFKVISYVTNKPLTYNKENLLNPWFLVAKL